jgi:serine/threonine protein kinase
MVDREEYERERDPFALSFLLCAGTPLDQITARGKMAAADIVGICKQITSAMAYLHSQGIVHESLRPTNIFVRFFALHNWLNFPYV